MRDRLSGLLLIMGLAVLVFVNGCEENLGTLDSGSRSSGEATMEIRLHDMPIDSAVAVNVFIERVEIHRDSDSTSWMVLGTPQTSYNLLDLVNGDQAILANTQLEPGFYRQLRLVLADSGHSVSFDSSGYPLKVPSGQNSGIKILINEEVEEDFLSVITLDFDVARSIINPGMSMGPGFFLLKPVIRAYNPAETGDISGVVMPVDARARIHAAVDADTVSMTLADPVSGSFKLMGLDEGIYTVSVEPRNPSYSGISIDSVVVIKDETADIGTIELSEE